MKSFLRCFGIATGLLFLLTFYSTAQTGKKFWYVAPDASSGHGDSPLYIRITNVATSGLTANVTIKMPANGGFTTQNVTVAAGKQVSVEVDKGDVENTPSNTINSKGLLIESDQDVAVFYEINHSNNPDKFTLKAENALGTEFFIPSQNEYYNHSLNPKGKEKIDIVATENGTVVKIKPTADCVGHLAGVEFSVTLNRGQTYCLEAIDESIPGTLSGTYISSDKNIAVTISDDSIQQTGYGNYDIIGDQLIPTSVLGTEYIAIRTNTGTNGNIQKVYILAVEDNTIVKYGSSTKVLQKGESFGTDITGNSMYINSSNPVYVYQVTGYGYEMGSAILPSITCTGSTKVSIKRNLTGAFWVQIMVKTADKDNFILKDINGNNVNTDYFGNNNNKLVWNDVSGTIPAKEWVTAIINLGASNATYFSIDNPYTLENSKGKFHLSVLDENGASLSYGYFSAYNSLRVSGPTQECKGTDITLTTSADPLKYDLKWYLSPNTVDVLSTSTTYQITNSTSGKYIIVAKEKDVFGCESSAALNVNFLGADFELPKDTTICSNATLTLNGPVGIPPYTYLWKYGANTETTQDIAINVASGTTTNVSLTVTDENNCAVEDNVNVTTYAVPPLNLNTNATSICIGQKISSATSMERYQWYLNNVEITGATTNELEPLVSGTYKLTGWTTDDCSITEELTITVNPLPVISLTDVTECWGGTETFTGPAGMTSYLWQNGTTNQQIVLTSQVNDISLTVVDNNGCSNTATASYKWYAQHPVLQDIIACPTFDVTLESDPSYTSYVWQYKPDAISPAAPLTTNPVNPHQQVITGATSSNDGQYIITAIDGNNCPVNQSINLEVKPIPPLTFANSSGNKCVGSDITLQVNVKYETYSWETGGVVVSTDDHVTVGGTDDGSYELTVTQDGCSQTDIINVNTLPQPQITLNTNNVLACSDESVTLAVQSISFTSSTVTGTNPTINKYQWADVNGDISGATANQYITNQSIGDFTLTIWDTNGCSNQSTATISRHPATIVSLNDVTICDNETYTLQYPITAPSIKSYQWKRQDGTDMGTPNSDWTVSASTTYLLDIIDLNDCPVKPTMQINHTPAPVFTLGANNQDKCVGDVIEVATRSSFKTYMWNNDPTLNQPSIVVVANPIPQTYTLRIEAINGCVSQKSILVTAHDLPLVDLGSDVSVCAGIRTPLTAPASAVLALWTTPEGTTPAMSINAKSGSYALAITDAFGCKNTDQINIVWRPLPVIDLGQDEIICPVDQVVLDAGAGASYLWEPSNEMTQTIVAMTDTVTMVRVQGINGCWGWDTKVVYEKIAPEYVLSPDTSICSNDSLLLDADPDGLYHTFLWSDGIVTPQSMIKAPGDYWVEVQDGCFVLRDTTTITFLPTPVIAQLDTMIYQQIAILSTGGTSPYQYAINDDEYQSENVFRNLPNGTYVLWVQDSNLCTDSTTVSIFNTLDLNIPNFITPNGDGQNDTWAIGGLEKFPESNIRIYDRYGKLLRLYKPTEPAWDGRYLNKPLASDDYWYVVELIPTNKLIKGNITLKR